MYFVLGKESVVEILVYSKYCVMSRSLPSLYLSRTRMCVILLEGTTIGSVVFR